MTPDRPEPLDPQAEARVRRLLAEARHDGPMPAEIAARLDDVLAGLAGERLDPDEDNVGNMVELQRRRRRVSRLLVAAAAVVAVGFGAQQVVQRSTGSGADATSGAGVERAPDNADGPRPARSPHNGLGSSHSGNFATSDSTSDSGEEALREFAGSVRIRPQSFSSDVRRARKVVADAASLADYDAELDRLAVTKSGCRVADHAAGRSVPVRYGGRAGVLVFRQPQGDSQVVDLYLCGYEDIVRSVTLSHP